jgi:hypothetical protein
MKTPSGDERDLDSSRRGVDERVAVRVRDAGTAVEERAVDVDGEEADHRGSGPMTFSLNFIG